jgi:hypothetical protein
MKAGPAKCFFAAGNGLALWTVSKCGKSDDGRNVHALRELEAVANSALFFLIFSNLK